MLPIDRVRNEKMRRRAGIERELASGADERVFKMIWARREYGWVPFG